MRVSLDLFFLACRELQLFSCCMLVQSGRGGGMSIRSHVLGQVGHQLSRDEDESEKKKKTIVFSALEPSRCWTMAVLYVHKYTERERIIFFFFYFNIVPRYYTSYLYVISLLALFFSFSFTGFFTLYLNTHTHMHKVSVWYVSNYKILRCR